MLLLLCRALILSLSSFSILRDIEIAIVAELRIASSALRTQHAIDPRYGISIPWDVLCVLRKRVILLRLYRGKVKLCCHYLWCFRRFAKIDLLVVVSCNSVRSVIGVRYLTFSRGRKWNEMKAPLKSARYNGKLRVADDAKKQKKYNDDTPLLNTVFVLTGDTYQHFSLYVCMYVCA